MTSGRPHVHWHDSHHLCCSSTLQFFHYRSRCRASILVQQCRMNMPLATIMGALFPGGDFGYYHSPTHPLPDQVFHNPIPIVDQDPDRWWEQLEENLAKEDLQKLWNLVVKAWNCLKMDDVLASAGNMSMEEGLLVCHFLKLASKRGTYPERSVAVVTTHYAQMVWLHDCVDWIAALNAVQWQAGSSTVSTTLELAAVLRESSMGVGRAKPTGCGGALAVEALEEGRDGTSSMGVCTRPCGPVAGPGAHHGQHSEQRSGSVGQRSVREHCYGAHRVGHDRLSDGGNSAEHTGGRPFPRLPRFHFQKLCPHKPGPKKKVPTRVRTVTHACRSIAWCLTIHSR